MKIAKEQGSAVKIRHGPATVNDVKPCPESHCSTSGWEGGQCVVVSQETYLNLISHGSFRGKAVKRGSLPNHRAWVYLHITGVNGGPYPSFQRESWGFLFLGCKTYS